MVQTGQALWVGFIKMRLYQDTCLGFADTFQTQCSKPAVLLREYCWINPQGI